MNVGRFGTYLFVVGGVVCFIAAIMTTDPGVDGEVAEIGWWFITGLAGCASLVGVGLFMNAPSVKRQDRE